MELQQNKSMEHKLVRLVNHIIVIGFELTASRSSSPITVIP